MTIEDDKLEEKMEKGEDFELVEIMGRFFREEASIPQVIIITPIIESWTTMRIQYTGLRKLREFRR